MARGPRERTAPDGLVVVDKPAGLTSHDVVAQVRRIVGSRKVGHAGTLDPMATGVLVCGVERATRVLGPLAAGDKEYLATARFGVATLSDDADGEVVSALGCDALDPDRLESVLGPLRGRIAQRPSAVSAIKVDGRRAHERVRAGETVELAAREVSVDELVVLDVRAGHDDRAGVEVVDVDLRVTCSSGTYVRSLARDAGQALGVGGHLVALRRTRVGRLGTDHAAGLDQLAARAQADGPASVVIPLGEALASAFAVHHVDADDVDRVLHGTRVPWPPGHEHHPLLALLGPDGAPLALSEPRDGLAAHLVVFS